MRVGRAAGGDGFVGIFVGELGEREAALIDDGQRLSEGPAIVQYIADQVPEKKLAPPNGSLERYRLQEWLTFISSELHKGFSPLFNPAIPDDVKKVFRDRLTLRFGALDKALAGRQYLMGSQFTVADGYFYNMTRWAKRVNLDLSAFPNVTAVAARIEARPKVQEAVQAEA